MFFVLKVIVFIMYDDDLKSFFKSIFPIAGRTIHSKWNLSMTIAIHIYIHIYFEIVAKKRATLCALWIFYTVCDDDLSYVNSAVGSHNICELPRAISGVCVCVWRFFIGLDCWSDGCSLFRQIV